MKFFYIFFFPFIRGGFFVFVTILKLNKKGVGKIKIDWTAAKVDYLRGVPVAEMSKKYGVTKSAIYSRSHLDGWKKEKIENDKKTAKIIIDKSAKAAADKALRTAEKISNISAKLLSKIEQNIDNDIYLTDAQSVRALGAALKDIKDANCIRSPGDMAEQKTRIKKLEKELSDSDKTQKITVVIDDSIKDFAN